MVKFEKDRFIIEIYVGYDSGESWSVLLFQLVTLLENRDPKLDPVSFGEIFNLLKEMLPSKQQAGHLSQLECESQ